jgi:hypothetical protein
MSKVDETNNSLSDLAFSIVSFTKCNVFLTGKAGTGKTTFLKALIQNTHKKTVVVAPTGVAAINAGGTTIHSFFQLPFGMYLPELSDFEISNSSANVFGKQQILSSLKMNSEKKRLIEELDLLVIDEVSMVKADTMDAIDFILKTIRKKPGVPFGGVQLLCIGDLFQLPPVLTDNEKPILEKNYPSPFFFDSNILRLHPLLSIELQTIYRQSNQDFISILNKIRNNSANEDELQVLEKYVDPFYEAAYDSFFITLCSHNYKANQINKQRLDELRAPSRIFNAEIQGVFSDSAFPNDMALELKEGAQIMFVKNDVGKEIRRYYNGKLGKIDKINDEGVWVEFEGEDELLLVEKTAWENVRFTYNNETGAIEEEVVGTFTQYPLKAAWAITIHKSQGLTFERAIIDAGDSFTDGQVYVALSRLTSLEGLVLKTPIYSHAIKCNPKVVQFMEKLPAEKELRELFEIEKVNYMEDFLKQCFNFESFGKDWLAFKHFAYSKTLPNEEEKKQTLNKIDNSLIGIEKVAFKFQDKVKEYFSQSQELEFIRQRVDSAVEYFCKEWQENILEILNTHYKETSVKSKTKQYSRKLQQIQRIAENKIPSLQFAHKVMQGINDGQSLSAIFKIKSKEEKKPAIKTSVSNVKKKKKESGENTYDLSLRLYQEHKSIAKVAEIRELNPGTIEGHMARFVEEGKIPVSDFYYEEEIEPIVKLIRENPEMGLSALKEKCSESTSYSLLRMAKAHLQYLEGQHNKKA